MTISKPFTNKLSKQPSQKAQSRSSKAQKASQKETKGEFGLSKKEFVVCSKCGIWFYDKSWHHALEDFRHIEKGDKKINFKLCPACQMFKDKTYEGFVILEDVPENILQDLISLIWNIGNRAFERDPLDRILDLKVKKSTVEIYTSENQLAMSITNQIKKAFKQFSEESEIKWSKGEDLVRTSLQATKPAAKKQTSKSKNSSAYLKNNTKSKKK